jgi:2,4-dienoyl-CoA reductase-like NADH-dependent reductase (Old Yellow Enzyme family)
MSGLFDALDLHDLNLPNRILMSRMTRTRARSDGAAADLMRNHYVQCFGAGLLNKRADAGVLPRHGIIRAPGFYATTKSMVGVTSLMPCND